MFLSWLIKYSDWQASEDTYVYWVAAMCAVQRVVDTGGCSVVAQWWSIRRQLKSGHLQMLTLITSDAHLLMKSILGIC